MEKSYITFELEGQIYNLKLGINAVCEFEEVTGRSITTLANHDGGLDFKMLRDIFFFGLKYGGNSKEFSLIDAGEIIQQLIDRDGMEQTISLVGDLFTRTFNVETGKRSQKKRAKL